MTTPSIEIPQTVETSGIAAASVRPETESARTSVDFVSQPSPVAVARFQAAMAEPLSENARAGRLLADAVALTQTSFATDQVIPQSESPADEPIEEQPRTAVESPSVAAGKPAREVPVAGVPEVCEKPVADVSLPPSVARISVVVSGEVVREVVATDQVLETPVVAEGERVQDAGARGAAIQERSESVAENPSTMAEVQVRTGTTGTTSRTSTTEELVRVEAERKTVDSPDAERLVAAGMNPTAAGVQAMPDGTSVKNVEAVAPIAALSVKDRVVRTDVLVEAATAVADTLLVSPGLMRGEGEILVQLKPDVLEGSQIRISVQGKTLDVAFQTPTEQLTQMLTTRLPELQQHLVAALPAFSFKVSAGLKTGLARGAGRKESV